MASAEADLHLSDVHLHAPAAAARSQLTPRPIISVVGVASPWLGAAIIFLLPP